MSKIPGPRGELATYRFAILLVLVSSVGFSLNGLIVRSLESATPWQLLFWRGLGVSFTAGFVVSLVTPPPPRDLVRFYFSAGGSDQAGTNTETS